MTSPDNFPGVYRAPVLMPPPPTTPALPFTNGTAVQNAQGADSHARNEFDRYRRTLPASGLVEGGRQFANTPAARAADNTADAVGARLAAAQARHDQIISRLRVDPSDAAAQTSAFRWWQRTKPLLDKETGSGLMTAISKIIDDASPDVLAAAVEELGPYVESRGQTGAYFDNLLASKLPELAAARDEVGTLTKAKDIVNHNRDSLHAAYQRGYQPPPPVRADPYDVDAG